MKSLFVALCTFLLAEISLSAADTAPTITSQPKSQTVNAGTTVLFGVGATGTVPLSFQWLKNGTPIAGASQSTYRIDSATVFDSGNYSVIVTNSFGSASSSNGQLTVVFYAINTNCTPAPSGLVSFWRAEGTANDSIGGANGTMYGGVSFDFGKVAAAFSFDGTNGAINVPDVPAFALTNSLTIEGWIRVLSAPSAVGMILFRGDTRPDLAPYFLDVEPEGTTGRIRFAIEDGNHGISYIDSPLIANGVWMHVAATLDGDTGAQKLYTNGVLAAQTITSIRPLGPLDPASGAGVGIGNHSGQPGPLNYPFKGLIDELSLYNRALSATEIQGIVRTNLPRCPAGAPPAIIRQPQSQTVTVGSYASFIGAGSGSPPYAYQWRKDGVPIAVSRFTGASSLTISNVKLTDAGTYSVIATNLYGSAVSSNVILTVNPGSSALRVADANTGSGAAVTVPVLFIPNGLENALSFSLNWNPARLSYVSTILANGVGATLFVNESQTSTGWLGVAMALPAGATFPNGSQELVEVSFATAVVTSSTPVTVSFTNQPIVQQVSDVFGNSLQATYFSGTVTIAAVYYEADVSPRPNGDNAVTVSDWVIVGRFAAHLETPVGSEFQRADCAPRATLGDGRISITDWVQAGRYAAGLDPLTPVGGATAPVPGSMVQGGSTGPMPLTSRSLQAVDTIIDQGQSGTLSVSLRAVGDENALGFSVVFDPAKLTYTGATLGSGAGGATLNVNTDGIASGQLGVALALSSGHNFASGLNELVKVTFQASAANSGSTSVALADDPIFREISDAGANTLSADYVNGTIVINPAPSLRIAQTDESIMLAWPSLATNFMLQEAEPTGESLSWTAVSVSPTIINDENVVVLPMNGASRFYRLQKQ